MELKKLLNLYDYQLPKRLIAQKPASQRDSARLLIYNRSTNKTKFGRFANLAGYLPKNTVLVFNQTKVWPARLIVEKPTGGKAELLYIGRSENFIKVLSNKRLNLGSSVCLNHGRDLNKPKFIIMNKRKQFYFLKPSFPISKLPIILKKYGITPLPPYIKNSPLTEQQRRKEYQAIFAKIGLSVAAPTASLHFTKKLMGKMRKQGIGIKFIQLDVGLGTFAPLKNENIKTGKLHQEYYFIDKPTAAFLNKAKQQSRPIIAVGTTVARTLESASTNHQLINLTGQTNLFIQEGYQFKFVDGLITNFHVPKSSLLMLVSAFAGRKNIFAIYQKAINKNFRFFSFGDGMLIL